jgi:hypothetical protein
MLVRFVGACALLYIYILHIALQPVNSSIYYTGGFNVIVFSLVIMLNLSHWFFISLNWGWK